MQTPIADLKYGMRMLVELLRAIGLSGVMAYSVTQRTSEIGIRLGLGARAGNVLGLILGQALILVLFGAGLGALGAIGLKKLIASQRFGVEASDPLTMGVVLTPLLLTTLAAGLLPARRATRVDPLTALRCE